MAEGFLSRWAKRKEDARQGRPLAEPPARGLDSAGAPLVPATPVMSLAVAMEPNAAACDAPPTEVAPEPVAMPTLQDAQALTAESDFKPFMARGVSSEVKNAAMKMLFTDPHYNVMDRMDIYIDDYSKSEPIPESMLRKMVGAQFLKLFEDEKQEDPKVPTPAPAPVMRDDADADAVPTPPYDPNHDDSHLRLQPDDAAPAESSGRGAE